MNKGPKIYDREKFSELWEQGVRVREIARNFNCAPVTVVRYAQANGFGSRRYPNLDLDVASGKGVYRGDGVKMA